MTVGTPEYQLGAPEVIVSTQVVAMMAIGTELQPMHRTCSEAVLHRTWSFGAGWMVITASDFAGDHHDRSGEHTTSHMLVEFVEGLFVVGQYSCLSR